VALAPSKREKNWSQEIRNRSLSPLLVTTQTKACFIPLSRRNKLRLQMS